MSDLKPCSYCEMHDACNVHERESQLSQVQGELEKAKTPIQKGCTFNHQAGFPEQELFKVKAERDALKAELAGRLSKAKDAYRCPSCDFGDGDVLALQAQRNRFRELLAYVLPLAKGYAHEHPVGSNQKLVNLAAEALSSNEERPIETLFSGQCNHHIPIGQPCKACNR